MNVFDQSKDLFRIINGGKSAGWMDKNYKEKKKNVLVECSVSTQQQPLSKVHLTACCRCLLTS